MKSPLRDYMLKVEELSVLSFKNTGTSSIINIFRHTFYIILWLDESSIQLGEYIRWLFGDPVSYITNMLHQPYMKGSVCCIILYIK